MPATETETGLMGWKPERKRFLPRSIIRTKQALRVEPLPEPEERVIYKRYRHRQYSVCKGRITCVICGLEARFVVYFKAEGCVVVEKYCLEHLTKHVQSTN